MEIAVLIFDDVNALDVIGPCEVLSKVPNAVMKYVSREPGPKSTDIGIKLIADFSLEQVQQPAILLVPGGQGIKSLTTDKQFIDWIRNCHIKTTWTVSVCTGALLLGAAGILKGLKATTHWMCLSSLANFGAEPQKERVVIDGKVVTSAGVSAGIDMALTLAGLIAGETTAKAIQLAVEYDPAPPFDSGSPDKAPKEIVDLILRKAQENKSD